MTKVIFSDGKELDLLEGTILDALLEHDKSIVNKTIAVKANGLLVDLKLSLDIFDGSVEIEAVTAESPEGLSILRHSTAHVLAQAVKSLFDGVKVTIGPVIEDGFYYDFDVAEPFTPEDLQKIEKRMKELIKKKYPISREMLSKDDAIKLFSEAGENYKVELLEDISDEQVSIYRQDDFVDLCRGPHLPSTGRIKAFKLLSSAGAYWRGSEKNKMLQRIYGTAFATKDDLKAHLERLEEAKNRDHRKIGKELDLFTTSEDIGAGLVLWHPKGSVVRTTIEDFWRTEHTKHDYGLVYTPHIALLELWKKSGHWDFYQENLFSPMDVDGRDYIVRPMNCPFHIDIYKTSLKSYRDLPVKYAELGTVYRYERSGVLHGLLRVRGFTQDDAHIFMTPDQLNDEIKEVLNFTLYILRSFGFNEFEVYLSTRPEKYVGSLDNWKLAEDALDGALKNSGLDYSIDPGEGVFYGPKIDIKIKDVLGRSWQCSTIQVDFNLPERFDVTYRDEHGKDVRPIMIHRALMGSLERFIGCLVEHYAGAFPVWLAPVQAIVLTVTERGDEFAVEVAAKLKEAGLRVEVDKRNQKLGYKIRESQLNKIPYMLVVGDREVEDKTVSPRLRGNENLDPMSVEKIIEIIQENNKPLGGDLS